MLLVLGIVDASLGRIPLLGLLLSIVLHLVGLLAVLGVSALGFARALAGESWNLPFLEDLPNGCRSTDICRPVGNANAMPARALQGSLH